ncbi:MAG: hypothetical protein RL660_1967 [Bacteroidota bacterium]|jgi:hypothetical protein
MKLLRVIICAAALTAISEVASAQCIKVGSPRNEVARTRSSYTHATKGLRLRERVRLTPRNTGDGWTINEGASLIRLPRFNFAVDERKNYCNKIIVK